MQQSSHVVIDWGSLLRWATIALLINNSHLINKKGYKNTTVPH